MATTPEEIQLFDAQKEYMSAAFDRILVLVEGTSILREIGSKPDCPQRVFKKPVVHGYKLSCGMCPWR